MFAASGSRIRSLCWRPSEEKTGAASSSNLPLRTDVGKERSTLPESVDDSGDYIILPESDNSEVQEKNQEKKETKDETNTNADIKMPKKHELIDAAKELIKNHPKPGVAGKCDTTLPLRTTYVPSSDAQHFNMAASPKTPPSQNAKEERPHSPPGLGLVEFPSLASAVPSKHVIRAISNIHRMAQFGQEVCLKPETS